MVRHYSDIDPFLELRSSPKNLAKWQYPTRFPQGRWGLFICLYEAGQSVSWSRIAWDETLPANTDIQFQLAFSNAQNGPWSYIGPDGTAGTFFTTASGEALPTTPAFSGRYARFKARLSSTDGLFTPTFGNVHLSFTGAGLLASSCNNFVYDPAGNITSIETVTDAGTTVDDRNPVANPINALNQVLQRDVGGVSWLFSYDLNGNLIGKTNGTDTFIYTWSDENRLDRVQGPGGLDVSYTYDTSGRMMTRTSGGVTTRLTWDGFDCVREETGSSVTIYHIPDGTLHSFSLDGVVYQIHACALGSVRMITDASGAVVARLEYGAWGEEIFVSAIPALADFPYRFVGGAGCRTDAETGLVYMRARHYNKQLQRFISRDPIGLSGGANLYAYADNAPSDNVDSSGSQPQAPLKFKKIPARPAVGEVVDLLTGKIRGGIDLDTRFGYPDILRIRAHCICPEVPGYDLAVAEVNNMYPAGRWGDIHSWQCSCTCIYFRCGDHHLLKVKGNCIPDAIFIKGFKPDRSEETPLPPSFFDPPKPMPWATP